MRIVSGNFFETLRIPLVKGRPFAPTDRGDTTHYAILSRSLANAAFGNSDPINRQFVTGGTRFTVIGVVGDVATAADGTGFMTAYINHDQFADNRNWALAYVVRAGLPVDQLIPLARSALLAVDPLLVLYEPRSMDSILAGHHARARFTLMLLAAFAAVAVTLAAVGIYGVLSYSVAQRTREIGVRLALGARPGQLRSAVMRQGLLLGAVGMVAGLAGALALGQVLQSLTFGVSPRDPLVFTLATLALTLVVAVAAYVPARRATRVEPSESLRD